MSNSTVLVTTFVFLYFVGFTFYFLTPAWVKQGASWLLLPPVLGLTTLSLFIPYFVMFMTSIDSLKMIGGALFLLGVALVVFGARRLGGKGLKAALLSSRYEVLAGGFTIAMVCLLGLNPQGKLSTMYLNGVDVAGYSVTADYLRNWKGYEDLEKNLIRDTNIEDITAAKVANDTAINNQVTIASEFILRAFRWSYSVLLSFLTELLGLDSVYRLNYVILALAFGGLFAVSALLVRQLAPESKYLPLWASLCVVFNANFLNVLVQGQYAQVVTAPIFLLLLLIVLRDRMGQALSRRDLLMFAAIIGSLMPMYNEMVFTFVVFFCILCGLDFLSRDFRGIYRACLKIAPALLLGMLLAAPVTFRWIGFLNKHLRNVRVGGWPQPHWATPAEFFGLANIYNNRFTVMEVRREFLTYSLALFATFVLVPALVLIFLRAPRKVSLLLLVPFVFVGLIFVKTRYIEQIHSYQYMKAYTFFLPIMVIAMIVGTWRFLRENPSSAIGHRAIAAVAIAAILFSGAQYFTQAKEKGYTITEPYFSLRQESELFQNSLTWMHARDITPIMLLGIAPIRWVNMGHKRSLHNDQDSPINYLVDKKISPKWKEIGQELGWPVIKEYQDYVLFKTPLTGKDISVNQKFAFDDPGPGVKTLVDAF